MLRLIATATMAGLIALFGLVPARAAPGYGTYVEALLAKPPEGVRFRPDLETYLDGLASSTRRGAGRKLLAASERLKR